MPEFKPFEIPTLKLKYKLKSWNIHSRVYSHISFHLQDSQTLWAVDLKIMYTSSHSMINFIQFISNCQYDRPNNSLTARLRRVQRVNLAYQSRRKKKNEKDESDSEKEVSKM